MQAKTFLCLPVFLVSLYTSGCDGNRTSTATAPDSDTTKFPPVETQEANADYKPAFKGQTRIAGVRTVTPYKVEKLAGGLGRPWAVIPLPDGRLLITEKTGFMQIHDAGGALVKKITGFPEVVHNGP